MQNPVMTAVAAMDCGDIVGMPVFSIRNGAVTDAQVVYVRPTIPAGYHWASIDNLDARVSMRHVGAFIRSAYAMIDQNRPDGLSVAQRRKMAICVGVARAVMTQYYEVTAADMIAGEVAPSIYEWTHPPQPELPADAPAGTVRPPRPPVGIYVRAAARVAYSTAAQAMTDLLDEEKRVVTQLISASIGIPALQGFSLMNTQHHYISTTENQGKRAYMAVEKQFLSSEAVRAWYDPDKEIINDALWHKAGHPISVTLKCDWAQDDRIARMLRVSGAGSAAARLPAKENTVKVCDTFITLINTVGPLLGAFGGVVRYGAFLELVDYVKAFPRADGAAPPALTPLIAAKTGLESRERALQTLEAALELNAGNVAYLYGFYSALSDQNALMGGVATADTLKNAYSLRKLKNQAMAMYVQGQESFKDYTVARNKAREEGQFNAIALTFRI